MKKLELDSLISLLDEAETISDSIVEGDLVEKLKILLKEASRKLPFELSFSLNLTVFDEGRERNISLLSTGFVPPMEIHLTDL